MSQSDIINNNFSKAFECIKCSNAYDTGAVLSEGTLFKQLSERKHSTFDKSKFTVVGSPTITDEGVASGFSNRSYITTPTINWGNTFTLELKLNIGALGGSNLAYAATTNNQGLNLGITRNGKLVQRVGNGSSWVSGEITGITTFSANDVIYIKYTYDGTAYTLYSSTNGETWITECSYTSETNVFPDGKTINIGIGRAAAYATYINGSTDLSKFSITVDGKEVFNGNKTGLDVINGIEIPYTLSKTGSKIVDVAYRDRVIDLYEQEGQAGYYTIDEENKNFTLPMGEIYGMIETLRSEIPTNTNELTNGAGFITGINSSDVTTALGYTPYNSSNPAGYITSSDLSQYVLSSSLATVATSGDYNDLNNKPTIPTNTNELTNGAGFITGINSSDVTTALGYTPANESLSNLNSTGQALFNGKAAVDFSNVDNTAKILMSGMGMPSNKYVNLTLGASGATYTAPANGYFCVIVRTNNVDENFMSYVIPSYGGIILTTAYGYSIGGAVVPVLKGQSITFSYEAGTSERSIKFVYAEGAKND